MYWRFSFINVVVYLVRGDKSFLSQKNVLSFLRTAPLASDNHFFFYHTLLGKVLKMHGWFSQKTQINADEMEWHLVLQSEKQNKITENDQRKSAESTWYKKVYGSEFFLQIQRNPIQMVPWIFPTIPYPLLHSWVFLFLPPLLEYGTSGPPVRNR